MDAVVIGAGHNGLVAANLLADEGWDVLVLEAAAEPGGAVRSGEITLPGFTHDLFSAFYPLAAASPVIRHLDLESHGLTWRRSPLVLANPSDEGCPILSTDLDETAASLDGFAPGDGDVWRELFGLWGEVGDQLLQALLRPFPPVVPAARLAARLGRDLLRFARFTLLPIRSLGEERFRGAGGPLLLAGNALHADFAPESLLSGFFGWLLTSLGQQHGYPVPEGGAGQLTAALLRRLEARGGRVLAGTPVTEVVLREGRAVGVRTADGDDVGARRAVLADVPAPLLYFDLVGRDHLPARFVTDLERFRWDNGTVKVDWALSGPIPWRDEGARRAGTIHVSRGLDHLTEVSAQGAMGLVTDRPYLVMGQLSIADPTRSPPGTETAWAYTRTPFRIKGDVGGRIAGRWDDAETEAFVARMESEIERQAPGFGDLILARHVITPREFGEVNPGMVRGALNSGTAQLYQQLVFRPTPGTGRPETPVPGLFLASASAHPGGGVHGAPGANAARAALAWDRLPRRVAMAVGAAGAAVVVSRLGR